MLEAGQELDASWEWIFNVMDSTEKMLEMARREENSSRSVPGPVKPMTEEANTGSQPAASLVACLRVAHGEAVWATPNVSEQQYAHVAIILDAIVAWQSCGVKEGAQGHQILRTVSHLRKVTIAQP